MTTTDKTARQSAWEDVQKQMNTSGPFVPILQPGKQLAFSTTVSNVVYNPLWTLMLADLK
ncbi:MAG: hypothetical protein J2O46_06460 [Nocardioides sp.]|nr:hypothetical protein [Nocardioides sp.]